jgi:peptidoglycan/LPS O-acetylase OafA/YrhL
MSAHWFRPIRPTSNELLHIDVLRVVAALGVVFIHSKEYLVAPAQRLDVTTQAAGLNLFVDLFFLISGYVIAFVYADRINAPGQFARFLQRRVGRLVPLHWLTLALSIGVWAVLLRLGGHSTHVPSFRPECIALTAALLHAGFPCGGEAFNAPSWSISAEMAMYVVFPAIALLGALRRPLPLSLGITLAAGLLVFLGVRQGLSADDWISLHAYVRAAPSFLIGVGLWYERRWLYRVPWPQPILAAALVALVWSMMTAASCVTVLALIALCVVSAVAADLQGRTGWLVARLAPFGQLTYSIYMWHRLFILVFISALGDKFLHLGTPSMIALVALTYGAILVWAYLSYLYLETPARRWVDALPLSRRRSEPA